uniref:SFRICE_013668 n=1 Tax=Spodoptera frugiperda TaxID=7108 RepID=A0A2H1VM84_SPOFR
MDDSNKKRKYVPETADFDEDRTQCSDDNDIFDSKMYSQPLDDQQEDENKNKDSSTYTEKNSLSTISVVDLHGSEYFGKLVSNELLRFDTKKRYEIMQKILQVFHKEK